MAQFLALVFVFIIIDYYIFVLLNASTTNTATKKVLSLLVILHSVLTGILIFDPTVYLNIVSPESLVILRGILISIGMGKVCAAVILMIDDGRRLFSYVLSIMPQGSDTRDDSRAAFLRKSAIMAGTAPLVMLTYGMFRNMYRYQIHRVKVKIKDLPEHLQGLRIAQLSDIHCGTFTRKEPIRKGIQMLNDLKPDLFFFTGDLVNISADEALPYIDIFKEIKSKYGKFSILGNHDYGDYKNWTSTTAKEKNYNLMLEHHQNLDWQLLLNRSHTVDIKGSKINIIGLENYSASGRYAQYGDMAKATQNSTPDAAVNILLSHDPSHWDHEVNTNYKSIDLTLAGHTHGCQFGVEIPGWLKWSPVKYIYPRWAGLYTEKHQHLYVNRGFGALDYPGRIGILPEITLIELATA